jgi:hypothetical protein
MKKISRPIEKKRYRDQLIWNNFIDLLIKNKRYEKRKFRKGDDALLQAVIRLFESSGRL